MTTTITLSRDGAEATVRVGDVVPTVNRGPAIIVEIDDDPDTMLLCAYVQKRGHVLWYDCDGTHAGNRGKYNIDIAALAARQAAARPAPSAAGDAERLRALVRAADPHIGQVRSDRDGNQYLGCTRSADGTWNTPVIVGASRLTGVSRPWNPFYVRPAHELEEVARFTDEVADLIEFLLNNRHALLAPPADVGAGLPAETINAAIKALEAGAGAGLPPAARDVLAERQRQVEAEGWTPEHDDAHSTGDLAAAAACYALHSVIATNQSPVGDPMEFPPPGWPWDEAWWKPGTARRDLVKAGALILAELERLDRAAGLTEG